MTAIETTAKRPKRSPRQQKVPEWLIYETINGVPYYRKGYKAVLKNQKKPEDIMGCSALQWKIISYLLKLLFRMADVEKYEIATNEPGIHLEKGSNMSADIMVFEKAKIPPGNITNQYINVPALLHIEVDVQIDLEVTKSLEYLQTKIEKLHAFGTGRIIWVFTNTKRVLVTESASQWHWYDWQETITLLEDQQFSIGNYLDEEGVVVA